MAKFCKCCGSPLEMGDRVCSYCGTKIVETATPQGNAPADAPRQPANEPHPNPRPYQQQSKTQQVNENAQADKILISKRTLIIAAVIVFIAFLLSLCSCNTTKTTSNSTTTPKRTKTTKVTAKKPTSSTSSASTALLNNTSTSGVKSFTLFDVDSKTLSRNDTKQLDNLALEIKSSGTCQVTVIGHADNTGTSEVNEAVSVKRAQLVADYLRKKGVTNITTSGESYNHPVAGNETAEGRAKNRRVEIYVSTIGKYNPYK